MTEQTLKGKLVETGRKQCPGFVWLAIQDRFTTGIPDLSVSGLGYGSWWEVKYADPKFDSSGAQELMMLRLEGAIGHVFYIIYVDDDVVQGYPKKHVRILSPRQLKDWKTTSTFIVPGFNHAAVVEFINKKHRRML